MPITMRHHDADGKVIRLEVETSTRSEGGCCGGAAPAGAGACCALDAELKQSGGSGCGCGAAAAQPRSGGCC
jgi:hypothetical protein